MYMIVLWQTSNEVKIAGKNSVNQKGLCSIKSLTAAVLFSILTYAYALTSAHHLPFDACAPLLKLHWLAWLLSAAWCAALFGLL